MNMNAKCIVLNRSIFVLYAFKLRRSSGDVCRCVRRIPIFIRVDAIPAPVLDILRKGRKFATSSPLMEINDASKKSLLCAAIAGSGYDGRASQFEEEVRAYNRESIRHREEATRRR